MKFLSFLLISFSLSLNACTNITVQTPQTSQPQTPQTASKPRDLPAASAPTETETASSPVNKVYEPATQTNGSCNYAAGTAAGGQAVNVDLCSIKVRSQEAVAFVYYLNSDRVESEANCSSKTWITFPEKKFNRPQSAATQNMLGAVCSRLNSASSTPSQAGTAIVFDPPSNVRKSPSGKILCSVQKKTTINIYGVEGSWYRTDACGSIGFIHADQVRF